MNSHTMVHFARGGGRVIVVVGGSLGAIDALRVLVAALPAAFPVPICVAVHTGAQSPGVLHGILSRAGPLVAANAASGERLRAGRIYVAPPDRQLTVAPGTVRVTMASKEHRFRPAIDPLFRSAAQVYGPGAIGVLLSGSCADGSEGLSTIMQLGGTTIVQDPADASYPSMPRHAIDRVAIDHLVTIDQVAPLLVRLTSVDDLERQRI